MKFIEFAVRRWQITLVGFALLAAVGVSAFLTIPRSVDPHFPSPFVIIVAAQPGADPSEMEQTVAKPIEDVLQSLDNIVKTASTSSDGTAVISAEFSWSSNPEDDYNDVVRELTAIRSTLPSTLQRLEFRKTRTTETAVLQIALVSDTASYRRLEKLAKDLRERLNQVPGVRGTRVWGIPAPELRVAVDSGRLAQLGLPVGSVTDALRNGGTDLPPGAVHSGDQRFNVEAGGAFRSAGEVAATPVRAADGRVVRVSDIGAVGWGYEEQPHVARYDGKRAIWVTLTQKDGINVLDVQKAAMAAIADYRTTLPPDVRLAIGFDQSRDISTKLRQLSRDFGIALALVLLTLLPLGFRASLVVMVSVPLSLAIGCAVLAFSGFTLNQLAISGFIIALGLLVDDSIVVTENIARHLRMGKDRITAAIDGTNQIAVAVIGCTAVLLLAFLPLTFLPEGAGKFIKSLPIAVLGTVAASLLVSLTIVPFLASRLLPRHETEDGNRFLQVIQRGIHRFYAPVLGWSLARPWLALGAATLLCISAFALIPYIGSSLFPSADTPYFLIEVKAPEGAAMTQTDRAVRFVEATLKREPAVTAVLANIGRGNPQVFYNMRETDQRSNYGAVVAVLDRWDSASPALVERLRARFAQNPDAQIVIKIFQNGPPIEAPIAVKVAGPDIAVLTRLAARVEAVMRDVPGTRDVSNPVAVDRTHLELGIDPAKAALLGVAPGAARRSVRLALAGEPAGRFRDNEGDNYNVVVRLPLGARQDVSALDRVYVPSTNGGAVPLRQIARPYLASAPAQINRERQQRIVSVSAQIAAGALTSKVNKAVFDAVEAKVPLPPGYRFVVGGEADAAARSFGGLGPIIALTVFGILGVLVIEFGRFRETAVVAGVIPLGMFGGLMALFLTGNSLSFTAVIGFVALIGIEIKNSILLVDFTTQLRRQGLPLRTAIEQAGEVRFLPVLLTSVTAIGGLLPLALSGSGLYGPLAWVIIGGLVSSTLLSRVVTPVMYLLLVRGAPAVERSLPPAAQPAISS